LAAEILEIGRASYRLRDDDNLHLARLEALVLDAVAEGRRRSDNGAADETVSMDPDRVIRALRHPNLIVEPATATQPLPTEPGLHARPRQLVGQPAGPGVAVGHARLIEGVDDLFEVETGEVLVCDAVDPNMTFVVPLASAVVERRGGMLVHGAIIAREYGLPCVTGVPDATALISTGDLLTVDGYVGIVTVSRPAAPASLDVPEPATPENRRDR
jgi:pyruvate,water dikinase